MTIIGSRSTLAFTLIAVATFVAGCGTGDRISAPRATERLDASSPTHEELAGDPPLQLEPGQPALRFAIKGGGAFKPGDWVSIEIRDENDDPDFGGNDKWSGDAEFHVGEPAGPPRRGGLGRAPVDGAPADEALRAFLFGVGSYDDGDTFESDHEGVVARAYRGRVEVYVPPRFIERYLQRANVRIDILRGEFDPVGPTFPEVVRSVTFSYDAPPARVPLPIPMCVEVVWPHVTTCNSTGHP
jgi:hypothetical protein